MKNIYETKSAKINHCRQEAPGVMSFELSFVNLKDQKDFFFFPGQFLMISLPGFGEIPVGISSSSYKNDSFSIAVREVGIFTQELHTKKVGDIIGVRGPFGKGYFPMKQVKGKELLLVAGGIGMIPLRSVILDVVKDPESVSQARLFYGARCEEEIVYKDEIPKWKQVFDINLTVDKHSQDTCGLKCEEGLITKLFENQKISPGTIVFIVGPPVMARFVVKELQKYDIAKQDIYISLERHMQCGVGACQHCGVGKDLVCEDGPVFSFAELENTRHAL